jgi:3-oxoacyl-[acyl-carrier protein] reductase
MNLELTGKRALVTGAAGGLGAAIARALSQEDVVSVQADRYEPSENLPAGNVYLPCDLADMDNTSSLLARAKDAIGGLDILVNCAGLWPTCTVAEMTLAEWAKTMDVNLTSVFVLSRDFVNHCVAASQSGVILNVTSQAAFGGATSGHAHYAAAKAGLVNFTRSLARETAGQNIRVNALAPGMMETPMSSDALAARRKAYLKRIPLGRIARPEEVADVAVFLCSPRAGYMTGATVDVSGGMLMH